MIVRYTALCPMVFGDGAINGVGEEVKALGCTRVLLLSDTITARQPAYATCQNSLLNVGIEVVEYPNCLPDPPDHIVIEASKLANAEKVDGLVAFGGGSVIDTAKAVKVLMNNPLPMAQYYGNYNYKPGVPLTAIPTTAGTGSETTRYAVISDSQLVQKKSFYVHADLGILDPEITASMPPQVTASTGMDAFSHSAEALTSQTANPHSDLLGSDSIRRIVQYLPLAVADGANHQARREMMIASNFAGSDAAMSCTHHSPSA